MTLIDSSAPSTLALGAKGQNWKVILISIGHKLPAAPTVTDL